MSDKFEFPRASPNFFPELSTLEMLGSFDPTKSQRLPELGDIVYAKASTMSPEKSRAYMERVLSAVFNDSEEEVIKHLRARMKKDRDRKSAPETIKRNVEICDLRKQNKKKWSMNALGKKYDMTRQSIDEILKAEEKWRSLLAERPSE